MPAPLTHFIFNFSHCRAARRRQEDQGSGVFDSKVAALRFTAAGGIIGRHRELVRFHMGMLM
jgi:hypothetical protein